MIRRTAFTLVELLVVIVIIGILMGLLLPAVQMARSSRARRNAPAISINLGIALAHYVSRHHKAPSATTMMTGMSQYAENQQSIYSCPTAAEDATSVGDTSYGANICLERMLEEPKKIVLADAFQTTLPWANADQETWDAAIAPRHGGLANVLKYDGSVQRLRPAEINPYDPATGESILTMFWRPLRGCDIDGVDCTEGGLIGEYWADTTFLNPNGKPFKGGPPDLVRVDDTLTAPIGELWGNNEVKPGYPFPQNWHPGDTNGNGVWDGAIAARWRGYVKVPATDMYTFYGRHDASVWITIDGVEVYQRVWQLHGAGGSFRPNAVGPISVQLTAGWHPIEVRFDDWAWSDIYMEVEWAGTSMPRQKLTATSLKCP